MPVKFRCPECRRLIAVPTKMVGKTINCPHNGCLVQVRPEEVLSDGAGGPATLFSAPMKLSEEAAQLAATQGEYTAGQNGSKPATTVDRPAEGGQWLRRNVARFIPGGGGATATLAADGRLPELKLQEGKAGHAAGEAEATNPLVMIGVLCLSFVMSTALLLVDFGTPNSSNRQALARQRLVEFYEQTKGPLAPYQQYLRSAQRAHARGDEPTEQQMYRQVLQLLRAEGRSRYASVTRTPSEDRELEKLLATLMAEE